MDKKMIKKLVSAAGMLVGVVVIVMGILVMAGVLGGNAYSASTASYQFDSGYASFGADFYTYVSNNAAEAASATRTVASNLVRIADLLKNALGILTIAFGAFMLFYFAIKFLGACEKAAAVKAAPAPAFVPEAANEEAVIAEEAVAEETVEEAVAEETVEEVAEEKTAEAAAAVETIAEDIPAETVPAAENTDA